MKRLLIITGILVAFSSLNAEPVGVHFGVNFDYFYTSLSPHGEWIEIDHDVIVWRPSYVRHSWRPYSLGRWTYTDYGWYWDSYEPFGWATYHYGRWYNDDYYGWVWFPDYEWGPSWVEWRYNDAYIGWAPLPPYASFHVDFGIRFSIGWHSRHSYWNFVSYPRFCHRDVNYYIVDNSTNINIYNKTKYRTNYDYRDGRIYNGGIDRNFVERRGGYNVSERRVRTTSDVSSYKKRRGNSNAVLAYRPGEKEVLKSTGVKRSNVINGRSKTSVKVDKVTTRTERSNVARTELKKSNERDIVRKSSSRQNNSVRMKSNKPVNRSKDVVRKSDRVKDDRKKKAFSKDRPKKHSIKKHSSGKDVFKKESRSKQFKKTKPSKKSKVNFNGREKSVKSKSQKKSYSSKKQNYSKKKNSVKSKSYSESKKRSGKSYKPKSSGRSSSKSYSTNKKQVKKSRSTTQKNSRR